MTDNSSKFFRKILKTGLVTASGAAIMLSSSGALGAAAARTTANNAVNLSTGANLGEAAAVFTPGSTLQFTGAHTVTAMNVNVAAVDMNNFAGGPATVTKSITLGSVVDNVAANKLNVSINNGIILTLTGTSDGGVGFVAGGGNAAADTYTALGNINLGGATAGLTITSATPGVITLAGTIDGAGILTATTDATINGTIGAVNGLTTINVGASTTTLGGATVKATTINLTDNASVLEFTNQVAVMGNIDNTGNTNNGVVNFNGAGNSVVTGKIGNALPLAAVNFKGAGAVAITGTSNATTFTVGNAGAAVTATGLMTGDVAFTAAGTLTPNGGITGDVNVSNGGIIAGGKDVTGDLVLSNGAGAVDVGAVVGAQVEVNAGGPLTIKSANNGIKFTGTAIAATTINVVDNAASDVGDVNNDAANGAGTGILNFLGAGAANDIGTNNSLAAVNFKGAGAVAITGISKATTFTVDNAGAAVTATGLMTGNVAFTAAGQLTLGNGIAGDITSAVNNEGTLIVTAGNVANVGTVGSSLKKVTFNNVGASNAGNIFATDVTVGNAGTDVTTGTVNGAIDFTAAGKLNAGAVTGTAVFNADGQLTLANGITKAVTTAVNNEGTLIVTAGDVANVGTVGSSLKKVTFNNVAASNAGNIFATDVTVNNAGTDVTTGTVNGAIDFTAAGKLNAGALVTGTAVFNADGQLTLGNGITGAVTTAVNDEGTLIVKAGNVAAVGGVGKSLKQVTFNGASTLNGAIDAQTITINGAVVANIGAITGDVNITSGGLTTNQVITGDLDVSGGNLVGAAATTNVTGTVTLQANAGNVTIKDATGNVAVAGGTLDLVNATGDMTITGGTVNQTGTIGGNLDVSGGGNLVGDAATTNVTGTVTLQPGAGVVTIGDALNAAAVSVGGGTLNLTNANGIDFDLGAGAGTIVTVAAGGDVKNVQNTTPFGGIGILTFAGAGQAGIIGNANSLAAVNVGAGAVIINGAVVKANAINLTDAGGNSAIVFADTAQVTGAILNTSGTNKKGIVTFTANAGDSKIIGAIGDNGAAGAIETLNTKVDAGKVITLGGDVYTKDLVLDDTVGGNAVGTVEISGNLTGDVTFGANANGNGGILKFNGNAANTVYDFKGAIVANPGNGTLNVNTDKLIAYHDSVGTLKQIDIQDQKGFAIDASAGDVTILGVGKAITFVGANSQLGFSNLTIGAGAKNILLAGALPTVGGGGGKLAFIGGNAVADILNVKSSVPNTVRNIGVGGVDTFTSLTILGQVATTDLDLVGIDQLDVATGANFVDNSGTSPNIGVVNIGAAAPALGVPAVGAATYTIEAGGVNVPILAGGKQINFAHEDAVLVLQNSSNLTNGTITLGVTLDPGAADKGIVILNSVNATKTLKIAGKGLALGTGVHKLNAITFQGAGNFDTTDITLNTTDIELNVASINLGVTNANIKLLTNTALTQTGNVTGFIDFNGQAGIVTLNDGVNVTGNVQNSGANNGTLIVAGASSIGSVNNIVMLKVGAGAVTLTTGGATTITEIQGTGTNTLTLPADFKLTGAINSTGGQAVKLNFTNGGSVSGVVGTAANPVGGITTAGTTTFTSAVNSKGPIITAGNTTFSNSLNNIGDVTTSGTTIFTGVYTNTGTATIGGTTSFANTFNNTGAVATSGTTTYTGAYTNNGTATFGGTTNFASTFNNTGAVATSGTTTYTGVYTNNGAVTFGGTTSFADTFNNTGAVTLAPASINNFAKNVTATSFVASNATMNFSNSLAFNSAITGSGTTINLGSGQLAYTGQGSFTDTLTLNSKFDGATNTGGNILITGVGSKMDLSGVTKLKLVISSTNFDVNNINPNTKYTLILAQDGGSLTELSSADIIETAIDAQENQFLKWTLNPSSLVLTASNISQEALDNAIKTGPLKDAPADVKETLEILGRAPADSEAGQFFEDKIGFIIDNKALVTEVIDSLQPDTVRTGDAVATINMQATSGAITSAITSLSSRMNNLQVANNQAAVSAGEEEEAKFGVWASPFVGNSTQKMCNNINGNKSNFNGATVGFDGMLNDNLVLGVAYTRADSRIKQKNDKIGDKSKVNSNIYSIYGLYNLPTNNLFFEAVGSYGDSRVKNYTKHLLPTARNTITSQIAHGKYKSRSYTGQVMVGYDYVTAQANLTPMAGIRYSNIKDAGYTETGTTLQNLIVKGKKYNIVEGLAGAKISTNVNVDQVILTPELYGLINYGFKNKAPAIDARLQGMDAPFPTSSFKSPKVSYNLGTGVTAKYQMMEYGVNYDVNIASKYFAQQGSLKVRVNF